MNNLMKLCILLLCILLVLLIVLVMVLVFYDRSPEEPMQPNPSTYQTAPTTPTDPPTAATTLPLEITEPTTEPATEPTTEPITEPTVETVPETEPIITDPGLLAALTAKEQVGKPYQYGTAGPDSFDASGLLYYCFKTAGVSIPRNTKGQAGFGEPVLQEDLRPGDAVFFWSSNPGEPEYVTIYIGDGQCVACLNSSKPAYIFKMTTNYYQGHFVFARRFY